MRGLINFVYKKVPLLKLKLTKPYSQAAMIARTSPSVLDVRPITYEPSELTIASSDLSP
jgi:hypothetical protein